MIMMPEWLLHILLREVHQARGMLHRTKGGQNLIASFDESIDAIEKLCYERGYELEQEFIDSLTIVDGETGEIMRLEVPKTKDKPYKVFKE